MDLETAGLDPAADQILEVDVAVTAPDLCIVAASEWVLVQRGLYQDADGNTITGPARIRGMGGLKSLVRG